MEFMFLKRLEEHKQFASDLFLTHGFHAKA